MKAATRKFNELVQSQLEKLVAELAEYQDKLDNSNTPQGKKLYGNKVKKLQTKITRVTRLALV